VALYSLFKNERPIAYSVGFPNITWWRNGS